MINAMTINYKTVGQLIAKRYTMEIHFKFNPFDTLISQFLNSPKLNYLLGFSDNNLVSDKMPSAIYKNYRPIMIKLTLYSYIYQGCVFSFQFMQVVNHYYYFGFCVNTNLPFVYCR